nr:CocE/NonD family hydrolase [Paenibacillus hamazuiensis]
MHIGGWYDPFLMGTSETFDALRRAQTVHRLLIGPWDHIPWGCRVGSIDHGRGADGNIHLKQVHWFDYWLKDKGMRVPRTQHRSNTSSWEVTGGGRSVRSPLSGAVRRKAAGI